MRARVIFPSAVLLFAVLNQSVSAQGLLNESGTSILAPSVAPPGGLAGNPQEYLTISWSVVENASHVYTYSYTVNNPANDVLLTPSGGLSSTPEIVDQFSVDFDTTMAGAVLPGTQTGGFAQLSDALDLKWLFSPAIQGGSSGPTVSFQSDLAPGMGNASASDAAPPSPWSSVSPGGTQIPVPDAPLIVPEPSVTGLMALSLITLFPRLRHAPFKHRSAAVSR